MKTTNKSVGLNLSRYLIIAAMTVLLVGCGGSGSGDTADPDTDGDGIPDSQEIDTDGDGIIDDLEPDTDGDGIIDDLDSDANGDGVADVDDLDGDGFIDVTDARPCGGEDGTDNRSMNNTWSDNCTLERESKGGQFADSLYTAGMQRVIYCAGFGAVSSVSEFADGEFGQGTELALIAYQEDRFPGDPSQHDGIVGPMTWAQLQAELVLVADAQPALPTDGSSTFDPYTVPGDRCNNEILFYQEVQLADNGTDVDRLGWKLAQSPNSSQRIDFSIDLPFGQI